jgi:hypothetical protein
VLGDVAGRLCVWWRLDSISTAPRVRVATMHATSIGPANLRTGKVRDASPDGDSHDYERCWSDRAAARAASILSALSNTNVALKLRGIAPGLRFPSSPHPPTRASRAVPTRGHWMGLTTPRGRFLLPRRSGVEDLPCSWLHIHGSSPGCWLEGRTK